LLEREKGNEIRENLDLPRPSKPSGLGFSSQNE
jgi:hypothetical protein